MINQLALHERRAPGERTGHVASGEAIEHVLHRELGVPVPARRVGLLVQDLHDAAGRRV